MQKLMKSLCAPLFLALTIGGGMSATCARAEEELAPGFHACTEKAQSTADNLECLTAAYEYWDRQLNANFKKAQAGKPSQFIESRKSEYYAANKEMAEYECEFIIKTQLEDGSWDIPWQWEDYPDEWAISKNWWKSHVIILNLLYLRGFGKL